MKKRILSIFLALLMIFSALGINAYAAENESAAEGGIAFYVTVSFKGLIASAKDESAMLEKAVTVQDTDGDGKITVDEALIAAHNEYYNQTAEDIGYASSNGWTSELWGDTAGNFLIFKNNGGISGVGTDTVKNGDKIVASVNSDDTYYADWYSFFDKSEATVEEGDELTLTLKGHLGMAYEEEDKKDVPLSGISLVLWKDGEPEGLNVKTDENGTAKIKFSKAGTYIVSAEGTVKDAVTDWTTDPSGNTKQEADCPIIAPGCRVTVTEKEEKEEMSDSDALDKIYGEFSKKDYSSAANTPLLFPKEYEGETYENVILYLKAWAKKETGRDLTVEYTYVNGVTSYNAWESGAVKKVTFAAFEENGDIVSDYFNDNEPAKQRMSNVYFNVGDKKSAKLASIYVRAKSKVRTDEEIAEYLLTQLPDSRILGKNEDLNSVVTTLGETSNNAVGALTKASTTMLYSNKKADISWSAAWVEGNEDALKVTYDGKTKSYKTTVLRPNVNEGDAKFTLTATVTAGESEKTKDFNITVPAFSEEKISLKITEGATLELTDNYYGKAVDEKYIKKEEGAPEGFDLYTLSLHKGVSGGKQAYKYTVTKEGFLTESGTFYVTGNDEAMEISLDESTKSDARLKTLEIVKPTVKGFSFSPEKTEYEIDVKGASAFSINASAFSSKATAKITSYYSSQKNADKGTLTTKGTDLSKGAVTCYIPTDASEATVEITVTAPEGSVQTEKEVKYIITAKKTEEAKPLEALILTASSTGKGTVNTITLDGTVKEEVLSPTFVSGACEDEYSYTVNYFRDQITIKPTASSASKITVNGTQVVSGKNSAAIPLSVGNNIITVSVTKDDVTTDYKINVRRKEKLILTGVSITEGELATAMANDGSSWTGAATFDFVAKEIHVTYNVSNPENTEISATLGGKTYTASAGGEIVYPVEGEEKITPELHIIRTADGVEEVQRYVVSFTRMKSYYPDKTESYLPAPGQFVNLDSWGNPKLTLSAKAAITLGAFGGNVVYKYDEPIKNDPKNPYGIDFIIKGNCFLDADGTTSAGAAEPAAVMVSSDGKKWYELAGSEYYSKNTVHNVTVTYKNTDTEFKEATEISWESTDGEKGVMPVNSYHKQSYFPNPETYGKYQEGIGKNESYKSTEASFTGTMIDYGFYPFGYADSHSANEKMTNDAVNPYSDNHKAIYNGDGFDISWAVDENGDPVKLDEISYIKVYNPVLSYGTSRGEISPEILSVSRAKANAEAVGVTEGLSALFVNGEEISMEDGKFIYEADAKGAETLKIKAVSPNDSANIYISNKRTASNEESAAISSVEKLRIIVQEGEKEPLIYIINLSNVPKDEDKAKLLSLALTPGDEKIEPNEENEISVTVESGVSAIRLTPVLGYKKAKAVLTREGTEDEATVLKNGEASELIKINKGENTFKIKVTSQNGKNTEEYTVTVTRKASGSSSDTTGSITVRFSLTGDIIHYENGKKHTEKTWIAQKNVTVPKGSTVKYLTEMMLNNAGISYVSDGIYISEINSLAEFDNGNNSGWMFRCNGLLGDEAYSEKILSNGDVIKWFYTDDYTLETGYENGWDKVNSSYGTSTSSKKKDSVAKDDENGDKTEETKKDGTVIFKDVEKDAWYFDAVALVAEKKLFKGVSDESFAPNEFMTRAMLATVLHRLSEEKKAQGGSAFNDVLTDAWYFDAVTWASESGIVKGMGDQSFLPDGFITREQLAVILFRYAALNGKSTENRASISAFSDCDSVSSWAELAMSWAVAEGILKGTDEGCLDPTANATRAEVAEILMRFTAAL